MYRIFLASLMLLLASGCGGDEAPSLADPLTVNTFEPEIQKRLVKKLAAKDIPYREKNESVLLVSREDAAFVKSLLNEVSISILPMDRSITLPEPRRQQFLNHLESRSIEYEVIEVFNQRWIVWPKSQEREVRQMLEEMGVR